MRPEAWFTIGRVSAAVSLATVLALVFAARAFTNFTPIRVKVITAPVANVRGRVDVSLPASNRIVPAPAAVVWSAQNPSPSDVELTLTIEGHPVCTRRLAQSDHPVRFDCQDRATSFRGGGQVIQISGADGPWSVSSLEIAVHHGRSSSPESIVVLPAGSAAYAGPSKASIAVLWCGVLLVLLLRPATSTPDRRWLILHRIVAGATIVLLTAVALAAFVTPYGLIVSVATFAQWVVILFAWRLWTMSAWFIGPAGLVWRPALRPWLKRGFLAVCVLLAFGSSVRWLLVHAYGGNYSGILHIARDHFDHNTIIADEREAIRPTLFLEESGGYDGQWVYFMTFDPLMRKFHDDPIRYNGVVDAPPYRFARMGLSALARLVSWGQWPRFPAAIVWIVLLGTVGSALALSQIAGSYQRSLWFGALVIAVPGFRQSIATGLCEPLAAALMLTAIAAAVRGRWLAAALVCAASLLTRETGLILAGVVLCYAIWRGQWRRAIVYGAIALVPLALWRLYVGFTLHSTWGIQAFFYSPDDIGIPFNGIRDLWHAVWAGSYYPQDPGMARAAISYPLLLTSGLCLAIATSAISFNPCALAAVGYGLLAVSLRFGSIWVHVGNGQRGTFELFAMLAVSATQSRQWPRWLRIFNVLFWAFALVYIFYLSFDASGTRQALIDLI